jgi:hypothetical protein
LRQALERLQEENGILKKQVNSNPLASAKHARLLEVQAELALVKDKGPKLDAQLASLTAAVEQLDKKMVQPADEDANRLELANVKLKYEEILEEKNCRITSLERKNARIIGTMSKDRERAAADDNHFGDLKATLGALKDQVINDQVIIDEEQLNQLLSVLDYADQVEGDATAMRMISENECFSLKQELEILKDSQIAVQNEQSICQVEELKQQLKQIQEESEALIERISSFEAVEREHLELSQENTELKDQLETMRKESEYYRGDLIPNLQKLVEQLKQEMDTVKGQNDTLLAEN